MLRMSLDMVVLRLHDERLELLLKPTRPVPPEALRAHRLREQELAQGLEAKEAMQRLLRFIGSRPLLGYYLEFDLALLEQLIRPLIGVGLPQPAVEVSALYHEWQFRQLPPYQQQGDAAAEGQPADDGVVDAEFEEVSDTDGDDKKSA